ncbi:type I inositol polyphosphate 5-phosphatase 4 [Cucumis melo var. makuwa]|uniref:Type I inositol polyphosphate 5-phosphatase 4 n=1 Tax=Cucumis melo var. makuwa TaxID=1194695 RepID=A0A5A7V6I0_CUCMM|nr:type I inositol polyphosphate 5-phosphatase 4 [Cucumis melo var. makuwa]
MSYLILLAHFKCFHLGPPKRRTIEEEEEKGKHLNSEDSIYHHPTLNPTGALPPEKPSIFKSSIGIARKLALSGYDVFSMDCLGFGLSEGLDGFIPSLDRIVDDVIERYSKVKVFGGAVALKLSWPKTLVKKWFNLKNKVEDFVSDDIGYRGGGDEEWRSNCSKRETCGWLRMDVVDGFGCLYFEG